MASSIIVNISHKNCNDGVLSAAIVKMYCIGNGLTFLHLEAAYGDDIAPIVNKLKSMINKHSVVSVLITDFSFPKEELLLIKDNCHELTVLDHHKSAIDKLKDFNHDHIKLHFDTTKAGCELTWEFLYPTVKTPTIVELVADRDLWKFEYSDTKPVTSVIRDKGMELDQWIKYLNNEQVGSLVKEGTVVNRHLEVKYNNLANNIVNAWVKSPNYKIKPILVNLTDEGMSEVLHLIVKHPDYTFAYATGFRVIHNDLVKYSVRSMDNKSARAEAEQYGGGGHDNAAGYETDVVGLHNQLT